MKGTPESFLPRERLTYSSSQGVRTRPDLSRDMYTPGVIHLVYDEDEVIVDTQLSHEEVYH